MAGLLVGCLGWLATPAQGSAEAAVALTLGSGTAPLFDGGTPLAPGHWQTTCVVVGADGARPGDRATLTAEEVSGVLAPDLLIRVDVGSGGGHGSCAGFSGTRSFDGTLSTLASTSVDTGWEPATIETRTFRIGVTVRDRPELAGAGSTGRLVWRLLAGPPTPSPSPTTRTTTAPAATSTATSTTTSTSAASTTTTSTTSTSPPAAGPGAPAGTEPAAPTGAPAGPPAGGSTAVPGATPVPPGDRPDGSGSGDDRPDVVIRIRGAKQVVLREVHRRVEAAVAVFADPVTAARAAETVTTVLEQPQYPIGALLLGLLFLGLQGQLERRDPKLADASLTSRDEQLLFPDLFPSKGATA